jgi:hypothetical protein
MPLKFTITNPIFLVNQILYPMRWVVSCLTGAHLHLKLAIGNRNLEISLLPFHRSTVKPSYRPTTTHYIRTTQYEYQPKAKSKTRRKKRIPKMVSIGGSQFIKNMGQSRGAVVNFLVR